MERRLALLLLIVILLALAVALGATLAQAVEILHASTDAATTATRYAMADITLRLATMVIFAGGLVGTFSVLASLRAATYSQVYGRFQTLLLKLAERPELFDSLKRDEYTDAEDDPNHPEAITRPHRFVANAMVNMYEEAFLLHNSRVLSLIRTVPEDYWQSMLGSMRAAFQLRYVRTHWEKRQAMFSASFNRFVRESILGYTGVKPRPDVA